MIKLFNPFLKYFYSIIRNCLRKDCLRKDCHTEIGHLGDLSLYSLEELEQKLHYTKISCIEKNGTLQLMQLTDKHTLYELYYTNDGQFIKIKKEHWKDMNVCFER